MDDEDPILSPEMIHKYREWFSEIESLAKPILKCVERLIEINETQRIAAAMDVDNFVPQVLSIIRNCANSVISFAPKASELLLGMISSGELYSRWLHEVRSPIISIYSGMSVLNDSIHWKSVKDNRIAGDDYLKKLLVNWSYTPKF